jgi:copper chaperone CopZ
MTCAHVVHVALKKVPGMDTVEVSLNEAMATVTMNPGNKITVPQLWQIIHSQGYTPKTTTLSVRGQLTGTPAKPQLKIPETGEVIPLTADPKKSEAYQSAGKQIGQTVVIRGIMNPAKDLKTVVPLVVEEVK